MPPVSPHVRALLEHHPWDQTIQRLLYYTLGRIRGRTWRGLRDGPMPEGKEVEDIVSQAIEDVLSGQRAWNPTLHPDLFVHLQRIVDSRLSHLGTGAENRRTVSGFPPSLDIEASCRCDVLPSDTLIQAEEDQLAEEFLRGFECFLGNDSLLQRIVRCIVDGVDKPASIAAHLGVTVEQIYAARRRLQRKWRSYRTTHAEPIVDQRGEK